MEIINRPFYPAKPDQVHTVGPVGSLLQFLGQCLKKIAADILSAFLCLNDLAKGFGELFCPLTISDGGRPKNPQIPAEEFPYHGTG